MTPPTAETAATWQPASTPPTLKWGYVEAALLPPDHRTLTTEEINAWRAKHSHTRVWFKRSASPTLYQWWLIDPISHLNTPVDDRVTHWAKPSPPPQIEPLRTNNDEQHNMR